MVRLYTAVGRYRVNNENGIRQPIVTVNMKESALSMEEMILWSCLMWNIVTKAKPVTYSEKEYRERASIWNVLRRFLKD